MRRTARALALAAAGVALSAVAALAVDGAGDVPKPELPKPGDPPRPPRPLRSLKGLLPPAPPREQYDLIVTDKAALVRLGKALFWDQMVGTRGDQACASCHFHAGADPRTANALDPGLKGGDPSFGNTAKQAGSGAIAGPNYQLAANDFPFHRLSNPDDRKSTVAYDTNDVVSSAGSFQGGLIGVTGRKLSIRGVGRVDVCDKVLSDTFFIPGKGPGQVNTRKVEPRNTPTMINAVFNSATSGTAAPTTVQRRGPVRAARPDDALARVRADGARHGRAGVALPEHAAWPRRPSDRRAATSRWPATAAAFAVIGRKLFSGDQALCRPERSRLTTACSAPTARRPRACAHYRQLVESAFRPAYAGPAPVGIRRPQARPAAATLRRTTSRCSGDWRSRPTSAPLVSDRTPFDPSRQRRALGRGAEPRAGDLQDKGKLHQLPRRPAVLGRRPSQAENRGAAWSNTC